MNSAKDQIFPVSETHYVLEVRNALGKWERMSSSKPTLELLKLYIKWLWPDRGRDDSIRVIQITTTESLLVDEAWRL